LARWGVLLLGLATAGCVTGGQGMFAAGNGGSVAFESIDGPPAPVFRKLVAKLNDEAQARRIAVVSREAPSHYRIRGYVSAEAHGKNKRNALAWVWDGYDSEEHRAVRLSGEVPAGAYRKDAWASADEKALGRIAESGMQQLAEFLNDAGVPQSPANPQEPDAAMVVASADRPSEGPNAARLPRAPQPAAEPGDAEAAETAEVPVPRRRPDLQKTLTAADLLTYAANRR
jgi:hypothetical protein